MLSNPAAIRREKESHKRCMYLRYLIERQKEINSLLPPVPYQILSQDGEEGEDDDIDNVDDLLDLVSL